jgi:adenine-specific DNA-methyltransferase
MCCGTRAYGTAFSTNEKCKALSGRRLEEDLCEEVKEAFEGLAPLHARRRGEGRVANANSAARELNSNDVVFLDPPYSGVHYSRFYHVLETVAKGSCSEVSGVGRYPTREERPRSSYSVQSESAMALDELLRLIASNGAKAILTFPDHPCSNGLSGNAVRRIAGRYFDILEESVHSTFSTLGGTNGHARRPHRAARKRAAELILVLKPQ